MGSPRVASSGLHINGMVLPPSLCTAISEGRWRRPTDARALRVFRERPVAATMLGLREMRAVNRRWFGETDRAYFGHPDDRAPPGDIDCRRSLIIGSLGPELPFALDYRADGCDPCVVYLHSGGDCWITVARGMDQLLERLDLGRRGRNNTLRDMPAEE